VLRTCVFGYQSALVVIPSDKLIASYHISLTTHLVDHPHHTMPTSFLRRDFVIVRIALGINIFSERHGNRTTIMPATSLDSRSYSDKAAKCRATYDCSLAATVGEQRTWHIKVFDLPELWAIRLKFAIDLAPFSDPRV